MSDETDNKSQVNLERNGNVGEEVNGNPIGTSSATTETATADTNGKLDGKTKKDWVKFDDDDNKNKIQVKSPLRVCVCSMLILIQGQIMGNG